MRDVTFNEIKAMEPEELAELSQQASRAVARKFLMLLAFKIGTAMVLRHLAKKLNES